MKHLKLRNGLVIGLCFAILSAPLYLQGFTQYVTGLVPMGHEWLTRLAVFEIMGANDIAEDPLAKNFDKNDPRDKKDFKKSKANNTSLTDRERKYVKNLLSNTRKDSRYKSEYDFVFSAIIGVRWVDIAGINVVQAKTSSEINVFDVVPQEPSDLQYDHFMRAHDDLGGEGGVRAARKSKERFVEYFVNAATAQSRRVLVWDGGAYPAKQEVDYNYFLFGRALHIFQDSFSPEHVVRAKDDGFRAVKQVNSFLCNEGAEQHSHRAWDAVISYTSGDVIWREGTKLSSSGWSSYKPTNMKTIALVATEASKDLWAAFIRSMAVPAGQREAVARREANTLLKNWMVSDESSIRNWFAHEANRGATFVRDKGDTGKGLDAEECMTDVIGYSNTRSDYLSRLQKQRRIGIYNIVPVTGHRFALDPFIRVPYNWQWKTGSWGAWEQPPADFKIPERGKIPDTRIVKIKSYKNSKWISPKSGKIKRNQVVSTEDTDKMLELVIDGKQEDCHLRLRNHPTLFLGFSNSTARLTANPGVTQASFKLEKSNKGNDLYRLKYNGRLVWVDSKNRVKLAGEGESVGDKGLWFIKPASKTLREDFVSQNQGE